MANTIKLKQGSGSDPSASDLALGEPAVRTDTGEIFLKKDDGSIAKVAGGIDDGDKGDITVSNDGATFTIDSGVIDNANVASNAAIAGSKISPDFGSQNVATTGTLGVGNTTISSTAPFLTLNDTNTENDFSIQNADGTFRIRDIDAASNRMTLDSSGQFTFATNVDFSSGIDVTGEITATSHLDMPDNAKIKLGTGDDLEIFHNGTHTFIQESGSGALQIRGANLILDNADGSKRYIDCNDGGSVELYHDGNKKFETTSAGATVSGDLTIDGSTPELLMKVTSDAQSHRIKFFNTADSQVARIFGDPSTGNLSLQTGTNGAEDAVKVIANGAVELYHNNSKKFQTGHGGEYGSFQALNGNNGWDGMAVGNSKFVFMGSNSDEAVGIWNDQDNEWMVKCVRNAETQLQHNGSLKLQTASTGISVTGRADLTGNLQIDAASPQIHLTETDTTTTSRILMSGGQLYIQTAASGQGTSTSAGIINLTGYNNTTGNQINLKANTINLSGDLSVPANEDIRFATGTWSGNQTKIQHHPNALYIVGGTSGVWFRDPDGTNRWKISDAGHLEPLANDTYDIGSSSNRIRDLYTGDLNLSNEGNTNDVDGTWGSYTIQEGEESLFLINKRNGKKYKFNLTEVS